MSKRLNTGILLIYIITAAIVLFCSSGVSALHCLIGWPTVLGPKSKDGSTTLSVWRETPFSDNFLIGGSSNSKEFTEKEECATNGVGCAYITNWNKVTQ